MDIRTQIKGLCIALMGAFIITPYFFGQAIRTKYYIMAFGAYCIIKGLRFVFLKKPQQACCDHNRCGCDRGRVAYPR